MPIGFVNFTKRRRKKKVSEKKINVKLCCLLAIDALKMFFFFSVRFNSIFSSFLFDFRNSRQFFFFFVHGKMCFWFYQKQLQAIETYSRVTFTNRRHFSIDALSFLKRFRYKLNHSPNDNTSTSLSTQRFSQTERKKSS